MVESGSPKPVMKVRFLPLLPSRNLPSMGRFLVCYDEGIEKTEARPALSRAKKKIQQNFTDWRFLPLLLKQLSSAILLI